MIHRQTDFAKQCGISRAELAVEIKRGKVTKLKNGKIDDSVEPNKSFILKKTQYSEPDESSGKSTEPSYSQLDKASKAWDVKKKTEETAILKIKRAKLEGILIPTDLVKLLIILLSKSITSSFHQAADNIITEMAHVKAFSSKEVAALRSKLIKVINKSMDDSVSESKKGLDNIVQEYSESRSRGERK